MAVCLRVVPSLLFTPSGATCSHTYALYHYGAGRGVSDVPSSRKPGIRAQTQRRGTRHAPNLVRSASNGSVLYRHNQSQNELRWVSMVKADWVARREECTLGADGERPRGGDGTVVLRRVVTCHTPLPAGIEAAQGPEIGTTLPVLESWMVSIVDVRLWHGAVGHTQWRVALPAPWNDRTDAVRGICGRRRQTRLTRNTCRMGSWPS